jgi:hypothetical protein
VKFFRLLAYSAVIVVGLTISAYAQVSTSGTIEVVVLDSDGRVVPGATVTASASDTVSRRTQVTDANGRVRLEALAPSTMYAVSVELSGFRAWRNENVLVRSGQVTTLNSQLTVGGVTETVQVTATSPVVDITSATTGGDITLDLTEALPTGRSYQSYLQLVPGVTPDNPNAQGNPAVRSGMNYSDIARTLGDNVGVSTDNAYYFDGINVTDPVRGTFGANLNTEIIQEQKVLTGGIPAEFVGAAGLISNVVTKSGSNTFRGSGNYFFQNSGLVSNNEHGADEEFSTKETAFTAGGPIMKDRAWFYGSFRYLARNDDVVTLDTSQFLRSVDRTDKQSFLKGTYNITSADVVSFTFMSDPTTISGSRLRNITNAQDRARDQGGPRYSGNYSRVWGSTLIDVAANAHKSELTDRSVIREASNTAIFRGSDTRTLAQEQLGGWGRDLPENRDSQQFRANATHNWNRHTFKGGFEWDKHINFRDTLYLGGTGGAGGAIYESIATRYGAVTAGDIATNSWSVLAFDVFNASDFNGLIRTIDTLPNRAAYYTAFDTNRNGTISPEEFAAAQVFNSTAGNPNGQINYDRTFQSELGPAETSSKGLSFFVQDEYRMDRWTFNVGVRTEQWQHFATTGENIFTFDWAFAPRLSAVYDILGNGRHRASAFWGRYYDPIRNDMTNFAGTLTGSVLQEQLYSLGQWVTYRTRGGAAVQDAFFSPTTKTPYTDDLQLSYAADLGNNQSFEATFFNRRTRDIFEDYDLELYATAQDGQIHYPGPLNDPNSLFLGLDYFGYTTNPGSNFVVGTLAGGKRDFKGLEFVYRKRLSNRWQGTASYNWNDGKGNSNSDGNADFQGDVYFLDPRAPNQYGTQPGLIRHLLKGGGSYAMTNGLQFGATMGYNSGVLTSTTFRASSRNLPIRVTAAEAFTYAGFSQRWIRPDAVGTFQNPSYVTLDLRTQYNRRVGKLNTEFFIDIFDLFNNQATIQLNDLEAGLGTIAYGDDVSWVLPRRAFVGARVSF